MGFAVGALLPSAAASESSRRTRLSLVVAFSVIVLFASAVATKRFRAGISKLASQATRPLLFYHSEIKYDSGILNS
jgi:hypothetical protein